MWKINLYKKFILFPFIILLSFTYCFASITDYSNNIKSPNIISSNLHIIPSKLILIKINPKITDIQKFIDATNDMFIDQLGYNTNLFSYISTSSQSYKIRDADTSYKKDSSDNNIYIAYTDIVDDQLISDISSLYNIRKVEKNNIMFDNNVIRLDNTSIDYKISDQLTLLKIKNIKVENISSAAPGEISNAEISFTNDSLYSLYKSDPSQLILISTNNNVESPSSMFLNNKWNTNSRGGGIEDTRINPEGQGKIDIPLLNNVEPGLQIQHFSFAFNNGRIVPDSDFIIQIDIKDAGQKVVEVNEPKPFAYTNFRESPDKNSKIVGFAYTGTKLKLIEENSGWMKVKFDGDKEGWTISGAMKKLN